MKRLLFILLAISLFNKSVNAREAATERFSRLTYGVEWGYVATVHSGYHYNYFAPEGFRVDESDNNFGYWHNADMYLHIGCNLNVRWNMSMFVGYAGAGDFHNVIPVSIRATRYFGNDPLIDRWLTFVDLGSGICLRSPVQEILVGKIGGGYRISLSKDTKLDFLFSARVTYTHPYIFYDDTQISHNKINRNNAWLSALSIGIALSF